MSQRVTAIDDALQIYSDRDLNSTVIAHVHKGVEIQLGSITSFEGRQWIEANMEDKVGYVLGPSARGHTTFESVPVPLKEEPGQSLIEVALASGEVRRFRWPQ